MNQADLKGLYVAIDQAFAQVAGAFPEAVRCGRGCDDCCHAVFDVSLVEALGFLAVFRELDAESRQMAVNCAGEAQRLWDELIGKSQADLARARIRCPLLGPDGLCLCYEGRPVNCRTYGVPTEIGGVGHVCGLSGFEPGESYPTINLGQIQDALLEMSVRLAGAAEGGRRWPLAAVILEPVRVLELAAAGK